MFRSTRCTSGRTGSFRRRGRVRLPGCCWSEGRCIRLTWLLRDMPSSIRWRRMRRRTEGARIAGWTLFFCDPQDLHDDAFGALTVEFGVEDALPGSEVEPTLGDRKGGLVVEEQGF